MPVLEPQNRPQKHQKDQTVDILDVVVQLQLFPDFLVVVADGGVLDPAWVAVAHDFEVLVEDGGLLAAEGVGLGVFLVAVVRDVLLAELLEAGRDEVFFGLRAHAELVEVVVDVVVGEVGDEDEESREQAWVVEF